MSGASDSGGSSDGLLTGLLGGVIGGLAGGNAGGSAAPASTGLTPDYLGNYQELGGNISDQGGAGGSLLGGLSGSGSVDANGLPLGSATSTGTTGTGSTLTAQNVMQLTALASKLLGGQHQPNQLQTPPPIPRTPSSPAPPLAAMQGPTATPQLGPQNVLALRQLLSGGSM